MAVLLVSQGCLWFLSFASAAAATAAAAAANADSTGGGRAAGCHRLIISIDRARTAMVHSPLERSSMAPEQPAAFGRSDGRANGASLAPAAVRQASERAPARLALLSSAAAAAAATVAADRIWRPEKERRTPQRSLFGPENKQTRAETIAAAEAAAAAPRTAITLDSVTQRRSGRRRRERERERGGAQARMECQSTGRRPVVMTHY